MLLGTRQMTLRRYDPVGSRDSEGRLVTPSVTTSEIEVSLQPLKAWELQQLDEGERSLDQRKAYTYTQLRVADARAGTISDELVDDVENDGDGAVFEVQEVDPYPDALLGHYKARVTRRKEANA